MGRNLLTSTSILLKVGLATFCLFGFPMFAFRLQSTSNVELIRSVAIYSLGVVALFVIALAFRGLDKDTARLFDRGATKIS